MAPTHQPHQNQTNHQMTLILHHNAKSSLQRLGTFQLKKKKENIKKNIKKRNTKRQTRENKRRKKKKRKEEIQQQRRKKKHFKIATKQMIYCEFFFLFFSHTEQRLRQHWHEYKCKKKTTRYSIRH